MNKKSGNTSLTATVHNNEAKETGAVRLKVVGFQGMRITGVEGCTAIPSEQLPAGSNSGYVCAIDKLGAGQSRTYRVSAHFDLGNTGQICLPVTLADGKTLLWQQGPVHFGTTDTSSDAPDTPLLLGTKNVPSGSATPSDSASPSASTSPGASASPSGTPSGSGTSSASAGTTPGASSSASPGGPGSGPARTAPPSRSPGGKDGPAAGSPGRDRDDDFDDRDDEDGDELAHTGGSATFLAAVGAVALLLIGGGAGLWAAARRQGRH
ncbi:hypothetical protein BLA24_20680 [Streptomyces cinnamoneus]|uniref:Gram-positive cocci surface proteins LPxTG domain-containing protein n=1 Tax=Streptomyces cinnamoneus TaxID=53446 RepID=A0A2G1XFW5_STRCJ|nr:hypothetical protein BLA24_20680 [Streptomyces cinnamoneus]PPT13193.1 hypothetical protein CYQ11_10100 [Streptomyces cinnamoneus]